MDLVSGKVLWAHNERERLPPASLTKILTAITIIQKGNLNDIVIVGEKPTHVEASSLGLRKGERISLRDLLAGILLRSANDACVAAAEHIAGSEKQFVDIMNQLAYEIGAKDSHFANSNGLPHPSHYSTAYDLALITRYAMQDPLFRKLVATRTLTIERSINQKDKLLVNKNKLLDFYPYATGVKTGYTREAGKCLVASAKKGNWELIAVLLSDPNVWDDAVSLLEYGFNNFRPYFVARKGIPVKFVKVEGNPPYLALLAEKDIVFVFPSHEAHTISTKEKLFKKSAPIKENEKVGILEIFVDGKHEGTVDILAGNSVHPTYAKLFFSYFLRFCILCVFLLLIERIRDEFKTNRK